MAIQTTSYGSQYAAILWYFIFRRFRVIAILWHIIVPTETSLAGNHRRPNLKVILYADLSLLQTGRIKIRQKFRAYISAFALYRHYIRPDMMNRLRACDYRNRPSTTQRTRLLCAWTPSALRDRLTVSGRLDGDVWLTVRPHRMLDVNNLSRIDDAENQAVCHSVDNESNWFASGSAAIAAPFEQWVYQTASLATTCLDSSVF